MSTVEKYYKVLGVNASSTLAEIRRSYRQKAKACHPDVNKSPDAHEQFVLLREAYEYLVDLKSGRIEQSPEATYTWADIRAAEARARAEHYAGMNFRDFKKSDYSKGGEALEVVADHINLVFAFCFSIAILSVLTAGVGPVGFLIGLVLSSIAIFFSYHGVEGGVNIKKFFSALWVIFSNRLFISVVIFVFNFVMVLAVGFQTLITLKTLLWTYIIAMVSTFFITYVVLKLKQGFYLKFYPICIAPLVINVFLIINYLFSSNPQQETYRFEKDHYYTKRGMRETSLINLANSKYDEYEGIRTFMDFESLIGRDFITYTFEDGLFGIRVMKDYELSFVPYE